MTATARTLATALTAELARESPDEFRRLVDAIC